MVVKNTEPSMPQPNNGGESIIDLLEDACKRYLEWELVGSTH